MANFYTTTTAASTTAYPWWQYTGTATDISEWQTKQPIHIPSKPPVSKKPKKKTPFEKLDEQIERICELAR